MKQPRFPYFDFSERPLDPVALRTHFAANFDALTLCRFSQTGCGLFHNSHKFEQKPLTRYYVRGEDGWRTGRSVEEAQTGFPKDRSVIFVGDGMLFGRLHAHVAKLDAHIFGPHPVGTIVELTTVDATVAEGRAQTLSGQTLHIDGSHAQLERGRFQAVYDYMDDSCLQTRYVRGFRPTPEDELFGSLYTTAQSFDGKYPELRHKDAGYLKALAKAEPRLWTALPNTIVLRASLTPHIGQVALLPTRRAHAHMVVARPACG